MVTKYLMDRSAYDGRPAVRASTFCCHPNGMLRMTHLHMFMGAHCKHIRMYRDTFAVRLLCKLNTNTQNLHSATLLLRTNAYISCSQSCTPTVQYMQTEWRCHSCKRSLFPSTHPSIRPISANTPRFCSSLTISNPFSPLSSLLLIYLVNTPDFTVIQIKLVFLSLHVGCALWNLATQPESHMQTTLPGPLRHSLRWWKWMKRIPRRRNTIQYFHAT